MTIAQIHSLIYDLLSAEQTGDVPHETVDESLHLAQIWKFNKLLPLYGLEQSVTEALSPFKTSRSFQTDIDGVYIIPSADKNQKTTGVTVIVQDTSTTPPKNRMFDATEVAEDRWATRMDSQLNEVTIFQPIFRVEGLDTLKMAPQQIMAGTLFYIKMPDAPLFKYTVVGRVVTQDVAGSVDLKWKESFQPDILLKALEILGVSLDDDKKVQIYDALLKDK
jgi:hypothetical protein